MGNQLAIGGSLQELHLQDLGEGLERVNLHLGGGRLLKSVQCWTELGNVVVKYLYTLIRYFEAFSEKLTLKNQPNVVGYNRMVETDKAGYLIRQYCYSNLADRISTRPFFSSLGKRWIAYQILKGLCQIHEAGLYHGDIKAENVVLTGWDWAFLTDLAPFKPTHTDPSNFSYFFDTAERRICPIAPERFYEAHVGSDAAAQEKVSQMNNLGNDVPVTEAMDMFSAGCVIAQLFLDGENLFDFSQLLAYRKGQREHLDSWLMKIEEGPREMISEMLRLDPSERPSAKNIFQKYTPKVFPSYFEWIHQFMSQMILKSCDDRIKAIGDQFDECIQIITQQKPTSQNPIDSIPVNEKERQPIIVDRRDSSQPNQSFPTSSLNQEYEGMEIISTLLCSSVRVSQTTTWIVNGLMLMQKLADYGTNYTRLQRLVPYTCSLLTHHSGLVKSTAIRTLTYVLTKVTSFPASEANLFIDYILPSLKSLYAPDVSEMVRVTFSEHLPLLSYQARRFLEMGRLIKQSTINVDSRNVNLNMIKGTFDNDLAHLQNEINYLVIQIMNDECNLVKRALLKHILWLCIFYGRKKTIINVLSYMITFLNIDDWRLRHAFLEQITCVSVYVGPTNLKEYILPCILQALYDPEEFVIEQAINGLVSLTQLGLFSKSTLLDVSPKLAPLLHHPNTWIRMNTVAYFSSCAKQFGNADSCCFLINSILKKHLEYPIWNITEISLLESIKPAVRRFHFDRALGVDRHHGKNYEILDVRSVDEMESLNLMKSYLEVAARIIQMKSLDTSDSNANSSSHSDAAVRKLDVNLYTHQVPVESYFIKSSGLNQQHMQLQYQNQQQQQLALNGMNAVGAGGTQNSFTNEWNNMFVKPTPKKLVKNRSSLSTDLEMTQPIDTSSVSVSSSSSSGSTLPTGNQSIAATTGVANLNNAGVVGSSVNHLQQLTPANTEDMHPRHLHGESHQHKGAINEMAVHSSGAWLVSGGNDGTVRLWDVRHADRDFSMTSKSCHTTAPGRVLSVAILPDSPHVALCNDHGYVHLYNADTGGSLSLVSITEDGARYVAEMNPQHGTPPSVNVVRALMIHGAPLIVCGTQSGMAVGLDPRMAREVFSWRSKECMQQGPISALCGHDTWMCTATRRGFLTLWDLRFQINVCTKRVSQTSVNRMVVCPTSLKDTIANKHQTSAQLMDITSPSIYVATASRDVKLFNLETQSTVAVFRCHDVKQNNISNSGSSSGSGSSSTSSSGGLKRTRSSTASGASNRKSGINSEDPYAIRELEQIIEQYHSAGSNVVGSNSTVSNSGNLSSSSGLTDSGTFEVKALHVNPTDGSFYTGSTDRRIRYWNSAKVEESYIVSGLDSVEKGHYEVSIDPSVESKPTMVVHETVKFDHPIPVAGQNTRRLGVFSAPVATQHFDTVTDIKTAGVQYPMLISASRDGIIKVWKG
ncbi:vacuolar protein sorting protein VPS15 [Acrasis kona]|uniref:non-specific serine/threonine protein kinase n=1 Tax=Acrasis kona TaxID=1008807 RepID=A0AAW2ZLH6_9EUKA